MKCLLTHCFCYPIAFSSSLLLPSHGRSCGILHLQLCGRSRSYGSKMSAAAAEKRVGREAWEMWGPTATQFSCIVWGWTWHHAVMECLLLLQRNGHTSDSVGGKLRGRKLDHLTDPLYSLDTGPQSLKQLKGQAHRDRIAYWKLPRNKQWFMDDMEVSNVLAFPTQQTMVHGQHNELEFEIATRPRMASNAEEQDAELSDGERSVVLSCRMDTAVAGSSSSVFSFVPPHGATPIVQVADTSFHEHMKRYYCENRCWVLKRKRTHATDGTPLRCEPKSPLRCKPWLP